MSEGVMVRPPNKRKIKSQIQKILVEKGVRGPAISQVLNSLVNYVYKELVRDEYVIQSNGEATEGAGRATRRIRKEDRGRVFSSRVPHCLRRELDYLGGGGGR